MSNRPHLRNISEIRNFFRTNHEPIYFVGPTGFNLLGLDRWARNLSYVTYWDPWEGAHPRVISPTTFHTEEFKEVEDVTNFLLTHPTVRQILTRKGSTPLVSTVFLNEETEDICREMGYRMTLPSHTLRTRLDSKLETTRIGDAAGSPSVPNVLAAAGTYDELTALAQGAGLGRDLVIQLPYGDSGRTTFFVASELDWQRVHTQLAGREAKIMRRIRNTALAVEACITRHGTIVGPFMVDLTGYPELTPYRGGWCGNDLYPGSLTAKQRSEATALVRRLGDQLALEGYTGFFEVDVLIDLDTDTAYLGELNPRISGASPMTNVTAGAYADLPLFLFHLLEYMDVDYDLDVDEINERWQELATLDVWSQLIMKQPEDEVSQIISAPRTGQYGLDDDGSLRYLRTVPDWHGLQDEREVFFMRVYGPGDYLFKGADLGIVVAKGRMQTEDPKELTDYCRDIITGLREQYVTTAQGQAVTYRPQMLLGASSL